VTEYQPSSERGGLQTSNLVYRYDDPHHWHARRPPTWKHWVAVKVTTCRGRGHIVSARIQAAQLVIF